MDERAFTVIAESEWQALPPKVAERIRNVALLVEDEPSEEVRHEEGLQEGDTLLGIYQGVPATARGVEYGVGATLPDTITLYRLPILEQAQELTGTNTEEFAEQVRTVIRETIWHEVAHYMGFDEEPINKREEEGTNRFQS